MLPSSKHVRALTHVCLCSVCGEVESSVCCSIPSHFKTLARGEYMQCNQ